ncbi:MAG TPA: hypothetical protein VN889_03595, partial [Solirubrobacteraceae bacterium]|nr:hypothetical protein [Solirubrobacteraceae bacterium]
ASHGEGEVTGPRAAVAKYAFTGCVAGHGSGTKCKSAGAAEEEIRTGPIDAELVYISEANREVAMLLNPGGGVYMAFECGGESAEGRGPFLAPVGPLNTQASSFTATLKALGATQTPNEYESPDGEQRLAISEGRRGTNEWVTTGVELTMTILPSVPGIVKAITAAEVEAKQQAEEAARQHEQKQREDEAAARAASAKQYEEAATAQLKHLDEEVAALRARLAEAEAAAAKKKLEEATPKPKPTRAQLLAKALHACKKQPKRRRASCEASARRKYRARAA